MVTQLGSTEETTIEKIEIHQVCIPMISTYKSTQGTLDKKATFKVYCADAV